MNLPQTFAFSVSDTLLPAKRHQRNFRVTGGRSCYSKNPVREVFCPQTWDSLLVMEDTKVGRWHRNWQPLHYSGSESPFPHQETLCGSAWKTPPVLSGNASRDQWSHNSTTQISNTKIILQMSEIKLEPELQSTKVVQDQNLVNLTKLLNQTAKPNQGDVSPK